MSDEYNKRREHYTKRWMNKEGDKLKKAGLKKFEVVRYVNALTKAYNRLCPACKRKMFADPKRHYEDYCVKCQAILVPIAKKYLKRDSK